MPGSVYEFGYASLSQAEIVAFARHYDPQSIHTDPTWSATGPFGGLIASGVQTIAARFADHATPGLGDLPRPGRPAVYGPDVHLRIVSAVTSERPEVDSQWSHRLLAEHLGDDGISPFQIGRILADLDLKAPPGPRLADPPRRP